MATLAIAALTLARISSSSSSNFFFSRTFNHFTTKFVPFRILHQRRRFFCHNCKRGIASSPVTIPSISDRMTAPYGSWKSPITTDVVSGAAKRLGGTAVDARGRLVWLESRPAESGRGVLVVEAENPGGEAVDITPKEFGVRTLAQEYGGGAFTVSGDVVFFANYKDQRLYQQSISSLDVPPIPLTPDYGSPVVSYADGIYDERFNRFVCVREDRRESAQNPSTTIVSVALGSKDVQGNNFFVLVSLFCEEI
ncbi:uncharacterized protein LOC106779059 [Vigna radiata var. radiata]|uniref:Uncharacterized protein LOC106779059 n=1 Tax=Vigna radiata var. radiata TaxID=3916 RepID=A0A1S3VW10_VIGRR|nr:uncharacterized protein LOC106779059 [Vigna radiata var. radiata]